jgi:predicted transcriptional regulator
MPVTSLKLPDELKERVVAAAADSGKSVHAFMLEAIERQTGLSEQRKHFVAEALAACEATRSAGRAYAADDVHRYMEAKAVGRAVRRPKAKPWR